MRKKFLTAFCVGCCVSHFAYANQFELHGQVGAAWPGLQDSSAQNINMDSVIVNTYTINELSESEFLGGVGFGYRWNMKHNIAVNLDLTGYGMSSVSLSGVNHPISNSGGGPFATLNYTANDNSYALIAEPKFIITTYAFEPYVVAGVGAGFNSVKNYRETKTDPSGGAIPTSTPFNNETMSNFAYEVGAGIQRPFTIRKNNFLIALDYRYMNWGKAKLAPYTGQPNNENVSFGNLTSSSINLGLSWMI